MIMERWGDSQKKKTGLREWGAIELIMSSSKPRLQYIKSMLNSGFLLDYIAIYVGSLSQQQKHSVPDDIQSYVSCDPE